MKRFPLYILLASSVLFTSCEKELNHSPRAPCPLSSLSLSLSGLTSAVRGVYSRLNTRYGYSGETAIFADGRGGDVKIVVGSYNHSTAIHQFLTDKSSGFSAGAYQAFATTSSRVNDILQYVGSVEKTLAASQKAEFDDQVAQLYALRGLAHLELARLFSHIPTTGVNLDAAYSGIPLNTAVHPVGYRFQRSTLRETYAQVIADLTKSLEGLSKNKTLNSGAINYWAAAGLLARTYLYLGDWQNAISTPAKSSPPAPTRSTA